MRGSAEAADDGRRQHWSSRKRLRACGARGDSARCEGKTGAAGHLARRSGMGEVQTGGLSSVLGLLGLLLWTTRPEWPVLPRAVHGARHLAAP